jgi:thioredoxin 1
MEITNSELREKLNNGEKVVVEFWATWCGPCIAMAPILKDVAEKVGDSARIVKIDVDKNEQISAQYNIQSIPTMILFKNGKVLWRVSGMQSAHQLLSVINEHK